MIVVLHRKKTEGMGKMHARVVGIRLDMDRFEESTVFVVPQMPCSLKMWNIAELHCECGCEEKKFYKDTLGDQFRAVAFLSERLKPM